MLLKERKYSCFSLSWQNVMKSVGVSQSISDQQGRKLEEKGVADTNRTTKVFRFLCLFVLQRHWGENLRGRKKNRASNKLKRRKHEARVGEESKWRKWNRASPFRLRRTISLQLVTGLESFPSISWISLLPSSHPPLLAISCRTGISARKRHKSIRPNPIQTVRHENRHPPPQKK